MLLPEHFAPHGHIVRPVGAHDPAAVDRRHHSIERVSNREVIAKYVALCKSDVLYPRIAGTMTLPSQNDHRTCDFGSR